MLFPAYVVLVAAIASAAGIEWPSELFTGWGVAWLLMPLAAVMLALRSVTRLRPRIGAMLKSTVYAMGAVLAVVLFVVYPFAV